MIPPPESSKSRHAKPLKPPEESTHTIQNNSTPPTKKLTDENWLTVTPDKNSNCDAYDDSKKKNNLQDTHTNKIVTEELDNTLESSGSTSLPIETTTSILYVDAFTDLDPLGTGKSKPYIDKKYFFQDLKNPPKKVLKDLSDRESVFSANFPSLYCEKMIDNSGHSENSSSVNDDTLFDSNVFDNINNAADVTSQLSKDEQSSKANFKIDEPTTNKTEDPIIGNNKALLVTDNDPFSPRMKKFDPFEDETTKSASDTFKFKFAKEKSTLLPDTKITSDEKTENEMITDTNGVFDGPLQVNLPPENYSSYLAQKRIDRQNSDSPTSSHSGVRNRPNVFKQNTVDVINSISSKKMKPHIFTQKFSKRDSNSINMRRLQESDSLSENETAPEPPPRPDSTTYAEPPPLPPKKQFSDIVIRPRVTSPLAISRDRYEYASLRTRSIQAENTPALPLPSRKVGRTDSNYPGPGRPTKMNRDDNGYVTPLPAPKSYVPLILLPPPQAKAPTKNRCRRIETTANISSTEHVMQSSKLHKNSVLPDITLSQLLTLGIDELAAKLNVPVNKLSTMTIVELTQYLSDFIENSSSKTVSLSNTAISPSEGAIFKVNFDQLSNATFIAKFDDNFGENDNSFVPNFEQFDNNLESLKPSVDKYAVFREIIDQEVNPDDDNPSVERKSSIDSEEQYSDNENNISDEKTIQTNIDTKITQTLSKAKDRYAALRDIILVEDLFDKSPITNANQELFDVGIESNNKRMENVNTSAEDIQSVECDENSTPPDINITLNTDENDVEHELDKQQNETTTNNKDDLEINELMNRAISNLSLDSRDHLSPILSKSPLNKSQNASTSPIHSHANKSPTISIETESNENLQNRAIVTDMSTSPIQVKNSSTATTPTFKSVSDKLTISKLPISHIQNVAIPSPVTDAICENSSPEIDKGIVL